MAGPLMLVWDLIANDNASAVFNRVGNEAEKAAGKTSAVGDAFVKASAVIGLAAIAVSAVSVKMAVDFQTSMLTLQTQAGASGAEVKKMSAAVLDLAGPVATAPEQLATSLYHIESVGIRGAKALDVLRIAAEGAHVGNADLEQTTNALTAAVASGIPGVQNMGQAMGALNAIVGAGDMKMTDLNQALGSGLLVVVKGFGLSLTDVGAALATFGDNNIRGADAATMLRMAVQAMAKPVAGGEAALKKMGITSGELARDMSTGGLNKALVDLQTHLINSGVKANEMGAVLTAAFGKRAGPGLMVLEGQMARFETKLADIKGAGNTFGADWQLWLGTLAAKWDTLKASLEAIGIKIGTALLPYVSTLITKLSGMVDWVTKNSKMLGEMALAIFAVGAVIKTVTVVTAAWNAVLDANPISIVIVALAALVAGAIYAYNNFTTFRNVMNKVWADIQIGVNFLVVWFNKSAMPVLTTAWRDFSIGVQFMWNSVLKPTWNALQVAALWMWNNVLKPTWAFLSAAWNLVGAQMQWVWVKLLKPVLDLFGSETSWLWNTILKPIFGWIWSFFQANAVGFKSVWDNIIHPVLTAFATVVTWLWNNVIKPILLTIVVGFITMAGGIIHAAALAFGWMGPLGQKLRDSSNAFDAWAKSVVAHINGINGRQVTVSTLFVSNSSGPGGSSTVPGIVLHALGGMVKGGIPGRDSVLGMLMPGEYIVRADGSNLHDAIAHYAGGVRKYAAGGLVLQTALPPIAQVDQAMSTSWGHMAKNFFSTFLSSAGAAAFTGAPIAGGGGAGGAAQWSSLVTMALTMLGQPASLLAGVLRRINFESGGNPKAINLTDSNAMAGHPSQGLMQTIPSTFAAYAGAFAGRGITDPFASIYAGLNYALHNYGSIAAIDPLVRPYGYAAGTRSAWPGWAKVGENGPEWMNFRGGETVLPNGKSPGGGLSSADLVALGDRIVATLLNMPKAYQLGARQYA